MFAKVWKITSIIMTDFFFILINLHQIMLYLSIYSETSFSATSLSANLGLVRLGISSEKTLLVRF